ncbi:energy-coupling factor transporter transmembrane component T family protein [Streptococcus oricebi]|uniref:Energy-coupling factor transporter transmembrane protein EcfT n=1 Tax=Streptococcus oricebi TaxID=1547447 RepID=A0ABS5B5L6_9STRE|nr:energy-coupling factor transporter transmembrane protein EcfT [Streptococcus oricebi]MBP2624128.1 cobalt ABC transporter permease [Streptococcus oricebi]
MDKMILGRYLPGDSILHRLDPRSKLLALFLFILIIFWANNPLTNLLLFVFTFSLLFLSKLPWTFFFKGLKSMLFLIAFTTLFQLFFTNSGAVLVQFSFLKITEGGLSQAGIIFCRFVLIIIFSTLLTLTTMPLSLADAVESLLKPLTIFNFPVRELGLMLSMSLRFVPTLADDTSRIMNAQRARGVDFDQGSLLDKVRAFIPLLIPLFASSFKRADALATAMEARGYQGKVARSRYRQLSWKWWDSLALLILFLLGLVLFILKS